MDWNDSIKGSLGAYGREVFIGHHTRILAPRHVFLGNRVRIDPFTLITTGLTAADNIQICAHAALIGGATHKVVLEDWTFIGYGSKLFCVSEDYSGDSGPVNHFWGRNKVFQSDITIRRFGGVASDVIVMPNVVIPEGCCIGAKSFVYKSEQLQPWSVYFGNPLRFVKPRNKAAVLQAAADVGNFWRRHA